MAQGDICGERRGKNGRGRADRKRGKKWYQNYAVASGGERAQDPQFNGK